MSLTLQYFDWPVYGLNDHKKSELLASMLSELTWMHARNCTAYGRIMTAHGYLPGEQFALKDVPFLPVRLFKEYELSSVPHDRVYKALTSSGTTSQQPSKIVLDRETSAAQTKALVLILQQFLGKARLPMLILDHPGVIKNRQTFSARGAGILGLSTFGRDHTYALKDKDMMPDIEVIKAFFTRHRGERIFLFGFTFMVWKYFYLELKDINDIEQLEDAILIHSGGWKKLQEDAVDNVSFKNALKTRFNINSIHDFYGMVEQVGSIFMECEHGRLHTPAFADVIIRNPQDWSVLPPGHPGLIQVVSVLPRSYPGHSLLTEDVGEWIGVDDCECGRLGRTFSVHGRVAHSELRGCSDTHSVEAGMNKRASA
jgi:hypothetical protein